MKYIGILGKNGTLPTRKSLGRKILEDQAWLVWVGDQEDILDE